MVIAYVTLSAPFSLFWARSDLSVLVFCRYSFYPSITGQNLGDLMLRKRERGPRAGQSVSALAWTVAEALRLRTKQWMHGYTAYTTSAFRFHCYGNMYLLLPLPCGRCWFTQSAVEFLRYPLSICF
ncbi:hypothetical protein F5884DRAFT_466436 [Xylogone sp. PMI_703]|nr:hypothetical protein F5884DRAFT_466436 [Xylogone sp. PMI_703]